MFFLQHDDMLELVKLEQAELRRRMAQEALLPRATNPVQHWALAAMRRLRSALRARPKSRLEDVTWSKLSDYPFHQ
jgi:hypothetical protein